MMTPRYLKNNMGTINQITTGIIKTIKKLVTCIKIYERNNVENNLTIRKKLISVKFKRHKNINNKCNDFVKEQKNNNNNKKYEQ